MQARYNEQLIPRAKQLRKDMTKEERRLWYDYLRAYPVKFSRQKVMGNYIVDFYCAKAKLVIELDGSQHYEPDAAKKGRGAHGIFGAIRAAGAAFCKQRGQ